MARAANFQNITEATKLFDRTEDLGGCSGFIVKCLADSAGAVDVRVVGQHASDESIRVEPGREQPFYSRTNDIQEVWATPAATAGADISYGVFA